MDRAAQNHQFDALHGLAPGQKDYLITQSRVVCTTALWTHGEAMEATGRWADDDACDLQSILEAEDRHPYAGTIITSRPLYDANGERNDAAFAEATAIVGARGWDEVIEGVLKATISLEETYDGRFN